MKRAKFVLAVGIWMYLTCVVLRAEPTPKIEFDQTVFDFGKTSQVRSVTGTFKYKNTGDGTLKLEKPAPSCGCTVAALEPDTQQPGQEGKLTFTLNLGTTGAMLVNDV